MKKSTLQFSRLMISLLLIVFICLHSFQNNTLINPVAYDDQEAKESNQKKQFIEEAFQQEFNLTKDPATNTVPRERLFEAAEQAKNFFTLTPNLAISGINWVERGPSNIGGRTRALIFDTRDATNNTLFAGAVAGGIWKCTNLTGTPVWTKMNDILDNVAISCIIQDPNNNNTFYAGTGETWGNIDAMRGLGIFKSTDGGSSWTQLPSTNNPDFYYTQRIAINTAGNIFAATSSGIKKSLNAGINWTTVLNGNFTDLEIAANNDLYAANFFGRVYKSTASNAGATGSWADISPAGAYKRIKLATAASDAQRVYILCEGPTSANCDAIYRTENGGTSWISCTVPTIIDQGSNSNFTRGQAWYDLTASVDPNNADIVVIGGVDALRTTNKGAAWTQVTTWTLGGTAGTGLQVAHADHHTAVFAPGSSTRLVWGTDGGVYFTDNLTNVTASTKPTVVSKNDGYNITQFYCGAIHPTAASNYLLAGAQDNGSLKLNAGPITTGTEVSGGDGAFCHINQTNANYQVTSYVYSNYYRSTNGGTSFSSVVNDNNGSFINPTDLDGVNNILFGSYLAGQYLRWPLGAALTKAVTVTNFGSATVTNVYVSPNTNDRIYFGLDNGSVVYVDGASTGNGGTITKAGVIIKTGIGSVSGIAIEPANENHILVTYSNYGVTSVFETTDGGTNWTSVEGNLPDMPVRWVIFNPLNYTQALLATEMGVWTTSQLNGSTTDWTPTNLGLANTRIDMLKRRASDNTILAVTHGRGLFTTTLSNTVLPFTYFATAKNDVPELAAGSACALGYTDIPVKMAISGAPASNVTVSISISPSSTASIGRDFSLSTSSLTFTAGTTTAQTFNIRVYDDNDYEGTESVVLNYSITAGGSAAQTGTTLQNYQLDILDNEIAPTGPQVAKIASGAFSTNLGPSSPLQSTASDKRCQYLYRASELLAAGLKPGLINSFNLSVSTKASVLAYNGFTIKLGTTALTDLSAGFASPTFTTVYSAPVGGFVPVMGENEFPLSFTWDGTSNLIFQYCYNNSANGAAGTDDIVMGESAPGYICQQRIASTTTSNDGCTLATANASNSFRPIIIFSQPVAATGIATILNTSKQAAIGPYETVHFYDGSGNILATVQNMDNWNYGCTTIDIDRAGTSATPFWNNTASDYVASKTIRIVPTTDNLSGNVVVTLYYTAAEKAGWEAVTGQTWNTIGMVKVKNAQISDVTPGNPMTTSVYFGTVTARGTLGTNYAVTASFNSGFSGFGVGKISAPVAITGLTFTGRLVNNFASLNWATITETNSRDFEIEKSGDGIFFHSIGSVSAAGNSSTTKQYYFTDPSIVNAVQYYRIKQNDILGNHSYSNIVRLQNSKAGISLWPNPFIDNINIQFAENVNGAATVIISDVSGRKMAAVTKTVSGNTWNINFSKLYMAQGTYIMQVTANGVTNNYKIVKE
ncbi:MAG: T9SS type A sorting domain-containing protein [Ferruginibacter sp.]